MALPQAPYCSLLRAAVVQEPGIVDPGDRSVGLHLACPAHVPSDDGARSDGPEVDQATEAVIQVLQVVELVARVVVEEDVGSVFDSPVRGRDPERADPATGAERSQLVDHPVLGAQGADQQVVGVVEEHVAHHPVPEVVVVARVEDLHHAQRPADAEHSITKLSTDGVDDVAGDGQLAGGVGVDLLDLEHDLRESPAEIFVLVGVREELAFDHEELDDGRAIEGAHGVGDILQEPHRPALEGEHLQVIPADPRVYEVGRVLVAGEIVPDSVAALEVLEMIRDRSVGAQVDDGVVVRRSAPDEVVREGHHFDLGDDDVRVPAVRRGDHGHRAARVLHIGAVRDLTHDRAGRVPDLRLQAVCIGLVEGVVERQEVPVRGDLGRVPRVQVAEELLAGQTVAARLRGVDDAGVERLHARVGHRALLALAGGGAALGDAPPFVLAVADVADAARRQGDGRAQCGKIGEQGSHGDLLLPVVAPWFGWAYSFTIIKWLFGQGDVRYTQPPASIASTTI